MTFRAFLLQWFLWFRFWAGGRVVVRPGPKFKKVKNMANLQFPELDVDGITIAVEDAGGNPAPLPDPSTVTTTYTSSDPTVLTVAPVAGNPYAATATSTGKVGTGVSIAATINFNGGAPSISGVSAPIDVPPGPAARVEVNLARRPRPRRREASVSNPTDLEIDLLEKIVAVCRRRLQRYAVAGVGKGVTADEYDDADVALYNAMLDLERAKPSDAGAAQMG